MSLQMSNNIYFEVHEDDTYVNHNEKMSTDNPNNTPQLSDLDKSMQNYQHCDDDEFYVSKRLEYSACTMKQLLLICEFYGMTTSIRQSKLKKDDIIEQIIWFESQIDNGEVVATRLAYWNYMKVLHSDKVLGKFIVGWKYNELQS